VPEAETDAAAVAEADAVPEAETDAAAVAEKNFMINVLSIFLKFYNL